jgi:AcrR family transcriptional regulator
MAERRSISERLAGAPAERPEAPADFVAHRQRARILAAAAEQFGARGYAKTTIESICKAAPVALATFYQHFDGKEECFLAAFDESLAAASEACAELVDPGAPWAEQVVAGLGVCLEMAIAHPARARLCLVESQAAGSAGLARYQAMLEGGAAKLREGRGLSPAAARLPDDLELALAGGLAWLVHQRLAGGEVEGLAGLLPEMAQITLTPYLGEEEAARAAREARERGAAATTRARGDGARAM